MKKRNGLVRFTILGALMLLFFVVFSIPGLLPSFLSSYPVVLIPFVAVVSLFEKHTVGGFFGLFAGMLIDLYSTRGSIYATVALCVLCFAAGAIAKHFLVENFFAALALTTGISVVYSVFYWLIFVLFSGQRDALDTLLFTTLPGIVYTVIFVLAFYPLVRFIVLKERKAAQ